MKIRTQHTLGKVTYYHEFAEEKDSESMHKAIILSNPPRYCHCCKNTEYFKMDSNKDKEGNTYINVVCTKDGCYAKAKLGFYKVGGYFWNKFERYEPKGERKSSQTDHETQAQPKSAGADEVEWDE
jgi:hypothetical protein